MDAYQHNKKYIILFNHVRTEMKHQSLLLITQSCSRILRLFSLVMPRAKNVPGRPKELFLLQGFALGILFQRLPPVLLGRLFRFARRSRFGVFLAD